MANILAACWHAETETGQSANDDRPVCSFSTSGM